MCENKDHQRSGAERPLRRPRERRFQCAHLTCVKRRCFDYQRADWDGCWSSLARDFSDLNADDAAQRFHDTVMGLASSFIPNSLRQAKQIRAKRLAKGTCGFAEARDHCSSILSEAYNQFVSTTRNKLSHLSSSKQWWSLAKRLHGGSSGIIPLLQRGDGSWATTDFDKAEAFADAFARKFHLADPAINEYSTIPEGEVAMSDVFVVRSRHARSVLENLRMSSGTGSDGLSAWILKHYFSSLVLPVRMLAQLILREGSWPRCWCNHWICPLHKTRSKADPGNYRGIHLTPQISKVTERVLGLCSQPLFEQASSYGPQQYAYRKGVGNRDALAVNTLQ